MWGYVIKFTKYFKIESYFRNNGEQIKFVDFQK